MNHRVAADRLFGRYVDVAVRALLYIADADVERRERRLIPLGLRVLFHLVLIKLESIQTNPCT